ncbi:unnamed protein product [Adineta steineri]|uniref:SIAH-type domain-containing protein n=1 Tax=Adineta steineri TaxID=433720 RepID=A0A816A6T8_9BILA|nr:unnamed protein product [Adineta steineri]CAF1593475.1 unnamed protein product [Adineta steineri]
MTAFVKYQPYLPKDRVINLTLPDLLVCTICDGIAWLPVACKNCEKPFCLPCIETWKTEREDLITCPHNCSEFIQRACPPAIIHILNTLQVTCRYKTNGCAETLSYNNLEKHEKGCGYRLMTCSGCDEKIVQKDFQEHESECALVSLKCNECTSVYQRRKQDEHTEITCLRVQLHQLRDRMTQKEKDYNDKQHALESQVNDLNQILAQISI